MFGTIDDMPVMSIYQLKQDRLWHAWDPSQPGHFTDCGLYCDNDNLYSVIKIGGDLQDPPRSEMCPICFKSGPQVRKKIPASCQHAPDLSIDPQHDIWAAIDSTWERIWTSRGYDYTPIDRKKFPLRIDEKVFRGNQTIYEYHLQGYSLRDWVVFPTNMADHSLDCSNL